MNPVDILLEMLLFILNSKSYMQVAMLDINIYIYIDSLSTQQKKTQSERVNTF